METPETGPRAAGIPVVASRTTGLVDIIEDGRTGLLVRPGDLNGLCAAIARLIRDPQYATHLSQAAQRHGRDRFGLSAMIDAYTHLYKELIS